MTSFASENITSIVIYYFTWGLKILMHIPNRQFKLFSEKKTTAGALQMYATLKEILITEYAVMLCWFVCVEV